MNTAATGTTSPSGPSVEHPGSSLRGLLVALASYAEARGRLLQIETQEAGARLAGAAIAGVIGVGCLGIGWLLALPALIWMIAKGQGWPWAPVALGAAGIHVVLAVAALAVLKSKLRRLRIFEETFQQFKQDREWIAGNPKQD